MLDPGQLEAERTKTVRMLRRLADNLERIPLRNVAEPLTLLGGAFEEVARRAEQLFKVHDEQ